MNSTDPRWRRKDTLFGDMLELEQFTESDVDLLFADDA